jgi:ArsR family transcriptional regulator, arsenate/arsenite/antimonite-responsive transcriptional repressor
MKNQPAPSTSIRFAKAVADPTRQRLMQLCAYQGLSVTELAEQLGLAQPTVSHRLAILKEAGLLEDCREGRQVFCRLNQAQMAQGCDERLHWFVPELAAYPTIDSGEGTKAGWGSTGPPCATSTGSM